MSETTTPNPNSNPEDATVKSWKRNSDGLLDFVNYVRNEDGSINWRKMVKPEFLVPNAQAFAKRGQKVPENTEGLDDKDLLILLGGIKDLARLRGYNAVRHTPINSGPNYFAVKTTIEWLPNFEAPEGVSFDALADASTQNTNGFSKLYLAAIAENRGFVRAVRNFLGINIAGHDEVGPTQEEPESNSKGNPSKFLEELLTRNGIKFESFKNRMIKEEVKGSSDWEAVADVPVEQVWEIADLVQKIIEANKAAKKS